jgi:hypothetical protein
MKVGRTWLRTPPAGLPGTEKVRNRPALPADGRDPNWTEYAFARDVTLATPEIDATLGRRMNCRSAMRRMSQDQTRSFASSRAARELQPHQQTFVASISRRTRVDAVDVMRIRLLEKKSQMGASRSRTAVPETLRHGRWSKGLGVGWPGRSIPDAARDCSSVREASVRHCCRTAAGVALRL